MKLLLTGDVMLNNHWKDANNSIFDEDVNQFIEDHHFTAINLESPVVGNEGENLLKWPRVHTSKDAILKLASFKPVVVNIGNNHVYDQLYDGFNNTLDAIKEINGISVGAIDDKNKTSYYKSISSGNHRIHLLSYVDSNTNPKLPADAEIQLRELTFENLKEDLSNLQSQEDDIIITSFHWGFDNHKMPAPYQRQLAHQAIDGGADLVWGHHAHVIQPVEYYKGKLIIYCQGNTCADSINENRILNKYQKTSFLASIYYNESNSPEANFLKIHRTLPHLPAHFVDRNYEPWRLDLFQKFPYKVYTLFYRLYLVHFFLEKTWLYFFGPGRQPVTQLFKILKKRKP